MRSEGGNVSRKSLLAALSLVVASGPTSSAIQTEEVLDLIAMPLAVAAVSEISGVPQAGLVTLVESLNGVSAQPVEIIEIVRYSPVFLADPVREPRLITSITNEVERGISREELVALLRQEIRGAGIDPVPVYDRSELIRGSLVPEGVTTPRSDERPHPHGGPPGQLKKDLGLQTGAEIVHGSDDASARADEEGRPADRRKSQPPGQLKRKAEGSEPGPGKSSKDKGNGRD